LPHFFTISYYTLGLIPWSLNDLATQTQGFHVKKGANKLHEQLLEIFPPGELSQGEDTKFDKPSVFVDVDGLIGVIHLPGVYHPIFSVSSKLIIPSQTNESTLLQNEHQSALRLLEKQANLCYLAGQKQKDKASWRTFGQLFKKGVRWLPGCLNISPAYFQQGHVSESNTFIRALP
jgi:hypothetical protein